MANFLKSLFVKGVEIDTDGADSGEVLTYNGTKFAPAAATATVAILDAIGDVTAPSPASGDFLKYNGSAWVNDPINLGTDTVGSYVSTVNGASGAIINVLTTSDIGSTVQAYNATLAAVAGGTYTGDNDITTVGTIGTGVWQGTAVGVSYGGTGATSASAARTNLGLGSISTLSTVTLGTDTTGNYVTTVNGSAGAITNVALTTGKLSQFAATTSAELAGVISDETGSAGGGVLVFSNSPSLTTVTVSSGGADITGSSYVRGSWGTVSAAPNDGLLVGNTSANYVDIYNYGIQKYTNGVVGNLSLNISGGTVITGSDLSVGGNITNGTWQGSIITSAYGGTGNGFTKFSGPATSEKTFTLPNASATILTTNAAVTVAQGGTGATTLTTNGVLLGKGTADVVATAAGTSGQLLVANSSGVPTFVSLSGDATLSSTGALTLAANSVALGTQTTGNYVATITGTTNEISVSGSGSETAAVTIGLPATTVTTRFRSGDGTLAAPAFAFNNETGTGLYSYAANQLGIGLGGSLGCIFTTSATFPAYASTSTTTGYQAVYRENTFGGLTRFTSTRESKENIIEIENIGFIIDLLSPVTFTPKVTDFDTPESAAWKQVDIQYGFIAEEVALVADGHLGQYDTVDGNLVPSGWKQPDMIAIAIAEIKSLRARVAQLEAQLGN